MWICKRHVCILRPKRTAGGQRGLVVSSHSSDGRGGWNSMEVFGRLLSLNLGGRPLVLGEAGLVWRCAATPMPTFGHMWVRATFLFMAVPAESTELSWIHPMTTIGTPVRHPGGFGILLMLAITGRCLASMCWHHLVPQTYGLTQAILTTFGLPQEMAMGVTHTALGCSRLGTPACLGPLSNWRLSPVRDDVFTRFRPTRQIP